MGRASTNSFVTEVELLPTGTQAKKLRARFEAARQVYNACLGECLRRLKLMRESRQFQKARKLTGKAERNAAFKAANEAYEFREYDLHRWCTQFTRSWINQHLGARTVEKIASEAFKVAQRHSFGEFGRPRFCRKGEMRAVDGKLKSDCQWKTDRIRWKGLDVPAKIDPDDPVVMHGLQARCKYVRMVRKVIRGKERFFAQLVCEGEAYRKESHRPASGVVGLDIGPQTIAAVGEQAAFLDVFCHELKRDEKRRRRLQRMLDRSRRAMNSEHYNPDGTIKDRSERPQTWNESRAYKSLRKRLAETSRKEADYRKNLHGQMAARILKLGSDIRTEKLSLTGMQRRRKKRDGNTRKGFGKSLGFRAPGLFLLLLRKEADKWGAVVTEFATRTTKLSRTCHCGKVRRKSLSQRWHRCPNCGVTAQRDLYSAFLARFVQEDRLKAGEAAQAWPSNCAALEAALSLLKDATGSLPASLGLRSRGGAPCLQNGDTNAGKIADVVASGQPLGESRGEPAENHRNPVFSTVDCDSVRMPATGYGRSDADTG